MSAFPSDYIENKVMDALFNNTSFTPPASLYLALYTTDPTGANTGTEVTGGSYARQSLSFAASSAGAVTSDASVSFANLPAATITHYGILDAATSGNLIVFGALPSSVVTNSGDELTIDSGDIDFAYSGS